MLLSSSLFILAQDRHTPCRRTAETSALQTLVQHR